MDNKLSYENDEHRLYGCAGMAISLVVYDGEEMLSSISIDNEPDRMFEMSDAFYFSGNPSLSAKAAWSQIVRNFHLTAAMAIGNALCRSLVLENKPLTEGQRSRLHDTVMEEGRESCCLEDDESERLFKKDYDYLSRVFQHHGVHDVAHEFVSELGERRTMSRAEVVYALRTIAML